MRRTVLRRTWTPLLPREMKIRALLPSAFAVAVLYGTHAHAEERAECAKAYEQTQRLRQESNMVRALEDADRCAQASCPDLLRNECTTWAKELRSSVARIVVHVRGGDGCAAEQASIVASPHVRRDGLGWLVDPGVQELTVTDPSTSKTKALQFDLRPGERRETTSTSPRRTRRARRARALLRTAEPRDASPSRPSGSDPSGSVSSLSALRSGSSEQATEATSTTANRAARRSASTE